MKKFLLLFALLLTPSPPAPTTVTGVGVRDTNGNFYSNGTISAFIVLNSGQPLPAGATLSSGPFPLDSTASFSISVFGPASYQFTVCGTPVNIGPRANAIPNSVCFTTDSILITGGSQDITANLNAAAKILGPAVGSTSVVLPNTNLPCASSMSFPATGNNAYSVSLTCSVTSSAVTGTPTNGNLLSLALIQDGVGGHPFTFPINFILPPSYTFLTAPLAENDLTLRFDGIAWKLISSSSGGGGVPGGVPVQTQVNAPGNVFGGAGCQSFGDKDTGPQNNDCDNHFKGPNPYVDPMRYGMRGLNSFTAIPAVAGITGTINSGSASLAVSTASCSSQTGNVCFVNGDGIVVVGAGATETMTTPVIASVTQSNPSGPDGTNTVVTGPSGGSTYNYRLISADKGRGMTVASATFSITTGQASLGKQTVSITSCSRSGVTVTCLTAAPHTMAVGTLVYLGQMSDGTFAGWYRTATVPDNTHFTYTSGFDTASGASVSETGGTALWKNENFIQWVHPATGAAPQQYIICSDRGGAGFVPIGISKVDNNAISATDLALGFDDLGSPMMDNFVLPYWVPANACTTGTPQNDELVTTILSGAGTTTLTLATTATNSATTSPVLLDNVPNFLTAVTAAGAGPVNIPLRNGTFVFNSYMVMPAQHNICQVGTILINDTVELVSGGRWSGECPPQNNSVQSFAWESHPLVNVGPAYPGFYQRSSVIGIHALSFQSFSGNQKVLVQQDGTAVPSGTMSDLNFSLAGSNEYTGMGLFMRVAGINDPSTVVMNGKFAFIGGSGDGSQGSSSAPLFYNQGGSIILDNISFAHRGIAFKAGNSGAGYAVVKNTYENGGVSPLVMYVGVGGISTSFHFGLVQIDTVPQSLFVNLSTGSTKLIIDDLVFPPSSDGTSQPPTVSGFAMPLTGSTNGPGYNNAISGSNFTNNEVSVYGTTGSIGYALPTPLAPTSCAVSAGGGVPIASNVPYSIVAIDANGNFSPPSAPCLATTTSGQQTVTIVPPARPVGAVTYQVVRGASQQFVNVGATRWTSNIVDTFGFTSGGVPNSAGQQSGLSIGTVVAPQVIVTGGGFKDTINFPGTADRTLNLPDANPVFPTISGIVPTSGYQNSAYDNFNRADGGLGANWTSFLPSATFIAPAIVSNQYSLNTNGKAMMAFWGANTFANDQFSQITVTGDISANSTHFALVRFSASGGYHCTLSSGANASHIGKRDNTGFLTNLTNVTLTPAANDLVRCEAVGTTINFYQNGALVSSVVDATFASGAPGSGMFINAAVTTSLDNWSGGNLHPISQLDAEQDWTQSQHILCALTLGPTNPIAGALACGNLYATQVNSTAGVATGSNPPACVVGTAGFWCATEGTEFTNAAGAAGLYPDNTAHEFFGKTNGATTKGMMARVQPGVINQTAQTAAIGTATLCASAAGACNTAGQYKVHFNFWGSGTACSSVTAGSVTFLLTWTDENAVTHTAVALQMQAQTGAATTALQASFPFQTALANESASGDYVISTNGTVIQYATGYTACTTGTGTYNLRADVMRLQ